jgi:hypothetical protein
MTNLVPPWILAATLTGTTAPQEAVQSGQKALSHWGRYPWYDAKADGLKPLDLSPPWWWEWLPDFQASSWNVRSPATLLQWGAWIAIALALGVMIYVLLRAYVARRSGRVGGTPPKTEADAAEDRRRVEALPLSSARSPADLRAAAEEQYRLGHYGQAIIYLFSHQLVQLDKRQLIHLSKGKTNRQYLYELGSRRPLRGLVEQTMVTFEDAFFGQRTIEQRRFELCWHRLDEFEMLAAELVA